LDFEPGTQYSYSNSGYNLLAAIVEKVTGQSFVAWTDKNIFEPLNMGSTHFLDNNGKIIKGLAYSYYSNNNQFFKQPDVLTAYGSSSLYSSVDDLSKWVIHFTGALNAGDPVFKRIIEKGSLSDGQIVNYGFGVELGVDESGSTTITHTGPGQAIGPLSECIRRSICQLLDYPMQMT